MSAYSEGYTANTKQGRIDLLESCLERLITSIENYQELEALGILDYMARRDLEETLASAKRELRNDET